MSRLVVFLACCFGLLVWSAPVGALDDVPQEGSGGEAEEPQKEEADSKMTDKHGGKTVKNPNFGTKMMKERFKNAPKVGDAAPGFTLEWASGQGEVTLKELHKDKPAVLVFGSFT